ncbi:MAG: hypothetical protein AAGF89_05890, partial [Bacteroidota bacterium]
MISIRPPKSQLTNICISLLLGLSLCWWLPSSVPNNPPRYLQPGLDWQKISTSIPVLTFANPDTSITHQLYLLKDATNVPLMYYADILTPVCIDGVCKPVYLEMYWDLLGQYVGFGEYPNHPLTKYDHDLFTPEDYVKLQELLLDRNSILDRKNLDDLYDLRSVANEKIEYNGVEIDGISGATKTEIKSSIVSGALYSCHRLWNLAHGAASAKIRTHLSQIYTDTLAECFLRSEISTYRYYAVRQMEGSAFADFDPIFAVYQRGNPLVRKHILKKIPDSLFQLTRIHGPLYRTFPDLDGTSKTLLIDKLSLAPAAAPALAPHLVKMTKNQLKTYLKHLQISPKQDGNFLK